MNTFKRTLGFALILLTGAVTVAALHINAQRGFALAKERYLENSQAASRATAKTVEDALRAIYENVRTLTYLPSVQNLDRHGSNLGNEGRATIQQIYNNLANNVSISEVYFLPLDFDPDRFDAVTGKLEEPILQFDQLIVNAKARSAAAGSPKQVKLNGSALARPAEEVETYEYHELAKQLAWLKDNYPDSSNIDGLNVPIIGTKELITCDNTDFIHSGSDADRSGFILSRLCGRRQPARLGFSDHAHLGAQEAPAQHRLRHRQRGLRFRIRPASAFDVAGSRHAVVHGARSEPDLLGSDPAFPQRSEKRVAPLGWFSEQQVRGQCRRQVRA